MLETCPETRGLFTLNGTLPWRFGPRDVEVDLLCASLRIAVEVDGWHHLQGPEAYRRDRRKDVELQRRGYLVVRVLADDVRQDMERTLAIVRAAVADRRREGPP
jgi:very-short-patch-repair endonuclease